MILVDTSVWVDHLRRGNAALAVLLDDEQVVCHPFVIGELVCGGITNRQEVLTLLRALPQASEASHEEALIFLADHALAGSGIGWIDVHLLVSAMLTLANFWTQDRRLLAVSKSLGLAYP